MEITINDYYPEDKPRTVDFFRVDRRSFQIGDVINPPDISYQDTLNQKGQTIERILTDEKPKDKICDRKTQLFLFTELSDAIRFLNLMENSKIYKVEKVEETTCFHRGDMNWTEVMNTFDGNEEVQRQFANHYWEGTRMFKPCWELIVDKVIVTGIIIGNDAARNEVILDYNNKSRNVEKMGFYVEQLNIITPTAL